MGVSRTYSQTGAHFCILERIYRVLSSFFTFSFLSLGKKARISPICSPLVPKPHNHLYEGITIHYGETECLVKELVVYLHKCLSEMFSLRERAVIVGSTLTAF